MNINGTKNLGDFEYQKFRADPNNLPAVATIVENDANSPVPVKTTELVGGIDYDYIDVQQTDADTETYVYKNGGSGGTTVQTITVNYTDSTKSDIDNVSWS